MKITEKHITVTDFIVHDKAKIGLRKASECAATSVNER